MGSSVLGKLSTLKHHMGGDMYHAPSAPENFSGGSHPSRVQPAMMKTWLGCKVSQATVFSIIPF